MARINTSITLEKGVYEAWKASGLKLSHLVQLGLVQQKNNPAYLQRINELEEDNKKLQAKIQVAMRRINQLEQKGD